MDPFNSHYVQSSMCKHSHGVELSSTTLAWPVESCTCENVSFCLLVSTELVAHLWAKTLLMSGSISLDACLCKSFWNCSSVACRRGPTICIRLYSIYSAHFPCRIYSDQPRWQPAYRLVVSEGRNVNVFPITSFGDSNSGLQFHLEKPESDDGISFSNLKSLVEHYK